ncbi:T9SS type A sorting domain-containing protein [Paracrocinitomix mangrovi]|uniref:T9SS type A sorting domain-containing protein n=1 Tax=Paracrocinitomix mangrovi TaxID=2862509 RepID=UPI001C8D108B|nr:T9SS type A sorting domain-containing protein [Paracrocinitomix mangrovi]UKN00596.1 T9SS type A sorting domain-containing protein [Paracrocinitomix mangrovi]
MKRIVLFFCLLFTINTQAQTWIDQNAIWHYEYTGVAEWGYFTYEYVQDTMVGGQLCQEIVHKKHTFMLSAPPNSQTVYLGPNTIKKHYTYVSGDTVFYQDNGEFFVHVNYGANIGDTWIISTTHNGNSYCNDTSIVEVIDTGSVVINTNTYRTVTLSTLEGSSYFMSGLFVERFGKMNVNWGSSQLFPIYMECDTNVIQEYYALKFRCFEDDSFPLYHPSAEDCDYPLQELSIGGFDQLMLEIYPNPAKETVNIKNLNLHEVSDVYLTDFNGKKMKTTFTQIQGSVVFDMSAISPGIYFLNVVKGDQRQILKVLKE